ncbi:MAG: hypothetical protein GY777_19695 [Candidatus Brocadiaceae bacterium]|nr:hypothetical protein [Candidatus Brocadiaceae bacterium]
MYEKHLKTRIISLSKEKSLGLEVLEDLHLIIFFEQVRYLSSSPEYKPGIEADEGKVEDKFI